MNNPRIPRKKALDGKFHERRPVGKPRLRRENNISRDSSLLLNMRGRRTLARDRDICRRTTDGARA
jgi:hypothetical protein